MIHGNENDILFGIQWMNNNFLYVKSLTVFILIGFIHCIPARGLNGPLFAEVKE
jgi:hypothetical protein